MLGSPTPAAEWVYLNGRELPRAEAVIDVEDRAATFGDGVYEVVRYYDARPRAMADHAARLTRSLRELGIDRPDLAGELEAATARLLERTGLRDAAAYWQVSRGTMPRRHAWSDGLEPSRMVLLYPAAPLDPDAPAGRARVLLTPDLRWGRCDVKSLNLLPNVLAKRQAVDRGVDEAVLHRDGFITEGAATSVWVVARGEIRMPEQDAGILPGVTRRLMSEVAEAEGLSVRCEAYPLDRLGEASEMILLGTTTEVAAVTEAIADVGGCRWPGPYPTADRLRRAFVDMIASGRC